MLGDLLRSGVPMLRSLELLSKQTSHQRLGEVLVSIKDQVSEGATLSDCMARHPKVFNDMATSMVRAGGEGGFLEEALDRVAEFTETQEDLKGRTMGAIAYPIFLAVVGTIVVTVLIVFFVPLLAESFGFAFWVAFGLTAVIFIPALFLPRHGSRDRDATDVSAAVAI